MDDREPEAAAEVLVASPFTGVARQRLRRVGDRVRRLLDTNVGVGAQAGAAGESPAVRPRSGPALPPAADGLPRWGVARSPGAADTAQTLARQPRGTGFVEPEFCCLGIIDECMLKCRMCDKWHDDLSAPSSVGHPSVDDYRRFLESLRNITSPGFEVDIGGGEALWKKETLDVVRIAADLGFRTTIASNGVLTADPEFARRVVDSGLSSIIFSVDSMDPKVHDKFRGVEGTLAKVMKSIDNLSRLSDEIHIGSCSIIMEETYRHSLDVARWVNSHGRVGSALFMAVMQPNNTDLQAKMTWFDQEFAYLWPQDVPAAIAVIDELIAMRRSGWLVGNTVPQLTAFKEYFQHPLRFVKTSACNMDKGVHVSAVGDVFMCFRHDQLWNIKDHARTLEEIWKSASADRVRGKIQTCEDNCHFLLNCFFEGDHPFQVVPENQARAANLATIARPLPVAAAVGCGA